MAAPVVATPVTATSVPLATPPKKEPTPVPQAPVADREEETHFDVAQNAYGAAKHLWSWGKSVPVVSHLLGVTEAVAAKLLDASVHMDLPALDSQVATPQLKKLDDDVVTPFILAVWKLIEPAVVEGDKLVIQPVLKEVVPRVLAPLGLFAKKKEEKAETKEAEDWAKAAARKAMIDISPNPEVVPDLN
jgi:hypothetical protein